MTSGLKTDWEYSGRMGRDETNMKIDEASKRGEK